MHPSGDRDFDISPFHGQIKTKLFTLGLSIQISGRQCVHAGASLGDQLGIKHDPDIELALVSAARGRQCVPSLTPERPSAILSKARGLITSVTIRAGWDALRRRLLPSAEYGACAEHHRRGDGFVGAASGDDFHVVSRHRRSAADRRLRCLGRCIAFERDGFGDRRGAAEDHRDRRFQGIGCGQGNENRQLGLQIQEDFQVSVRFAKASVHGWCVLIVERLQRRAHVEKVVVVCREGKPCEATAAQLWNPSMRRRTLSGPSGHATRPGVL